MLLGPRSRPSHRSTTPAGECAGVRRRRLTRLVALGTLLAAAAVLLSACTGIEGGSVSVDQPGGVGAVRLQATLCTGHNGDSACAAAPADQEGQVTIALAVPDGTAMPDSIAATPSVGGALPTVLQRNAELGQKMGEELPPAEGSELVAYRSGVIAESGSEERAWSIEPTMGLPSGEAGGPFAGPFALRTTWAWQLVDGTHPADRPLECNEPEVEARPAVECIGNTTNAAQTVESDTSDLLISAPSTTAVSGTTAQLGFSLEFASSVGTPPDFELAATSTLPGATPAISNASFEPGPMEEDGRAAPGSRTVTVAVPAGTQPGTYEVTLTATTPGGGSVSATAHLRVTAGEEPVNPSGPSGGAAPEASSSGTSGTTSSGPSGTATPLLRMAVFAPRKIASGTASRKGIPVRVTMPEAGSEVTVRLEGLTSGGRPSRLLTRRWAAKIPGSTLR